MIRELYSDSIRAPIPRFNPRQKEERGRRAAVAINALNAPSLFRNRSLLERHLTPPFAEAASFLHLAAPGYIPFDAGAGLGQDDGGKVFTITRVLSQQALFPFSNHGL